MSTPAPCAFERATGRPCPVCRSPQPTSQPEDAADHPDHLDLAATVDRIAAVQCYAERGLHLLTIEIDALTPEERRGLDGWAASAAGVIPGVTRCHIAGPVMPGGDRLLQACTRCHVVLQDHARIVEDGAYPVGHHVGLDCDGRPTPAEKGPDDAD